MTVLVVHVLQAPVPLTHRQSTNFCCAFLNLTEENSQLLQRNVSWTILPPVRLATMYCGLKSRVLISRKLFWSCEDPITAYLFICHKLILYFHKHLERLLPESFVWMVFSVPPVLKPRKNKQTLSKYSFSQILRHFWALYLKTMCHSRHPPVLWLDRKFWDWHEEMKRLAQWVNEGT